MLRNKSYEQYGYMKHEMDVEIKNLSTVLENISKAGAWSIRVNYNDWGVKPIANVSFCTNKQ